jgi:flagellar motor switch protein FliM
MLSQSEIDALLGAVGSSPVDEVLEDPTPAPARQGGSTRAVKVYDFRRPDKFSKDQLRTLQAIHENFARLTAGRLTARLRTSVHLQLADSEQIVFDEYIGALQLPTQLIVLRADGLAGPFLVNLDLGLAFAFVDRTLGGPGRISQERREPTAIESELIARIIDDIIPAFAEAWAHLQTVEPHVEELALGPSLLRVAAPTQVVAVLTLEVRIAGQNGSLTICYPHQSLEPLMSRLSASAWYAQPDRGREIGAQRDDLEASLDLVEVPITAYLGSVELPVEVLAGIEPGDVIRLDDRADRPIVVSFADRVRAWAVPGRSGDRLALQLVTPLAAVED